MTLIRIARTIIITIAFTSCFHKERSHECLLSDLGSSRSQFTTYGTWESSNRSKKKKKKKKKKNG